MFGQPADQSEAIALMAARMCINLGQVASRRQISPIDQRTRLNRCGTCKNASTCYSFLRTRPEKIEAAAIARTAISSTT
ncbi:DUF6455 family protein [Paracoccus zhejiangensis]|uniref:DUF6455 family protein n=1 Tax=Paracoccus zhejiangensis TaxID=1077935 RepID=UPI0012FFD754|nr:DUF6455 family protein [Paracoccus zhejiangensis]